MTGKLEVKELTAGYGEITAIRQVCVEVQPGEVVAVLGPNGAGKSTLLATIAGIHPASSGEVRIGGEPVHGLRGHKRVQRGLALVQEKCVFRRMTVRDNLVVACPRVRPAEFAARAESATSFFPVLRTFMARTAGELSGGQQQMLAIAQALMSQPRFLLLDEPSSGLSPILITEVMDRAGDIARGGVGVLLVEQAVHQATRVASRVYSLRLGQCSELPQFTSSESLAALEGIYLK